MEPKNTKPIIAYECLSVTYLRRNFVDLLIDFFKFGLAQVKLSAHHLRRVILHEHLNDFVHVEIDQLDALLLDWGTESFSKPNWNFISSQS